MDAKEIIRLLEDCKYPIELMHEGNHDESELLSKISKAITDLKSLHTPPTKPVTDAEIEEALFEEAKRQKLDFTKTSKFAFGWRMCAKFMQSKIAERWLKSVTKKPTKDDIEWAKSQLLKRKDKAITRTAREGKKKLYHCDFCNQSTKHVDEVCQKCKPF